MVAGELAATLSPRPGYRCATLSLQAYQVAAMAVERQGYSPATSSTAMPHREPPMRAASDSDDIANILSRIESSDWHVRQTACHTLAKSAPRGHPRVVSALLCRLLDRDQYVRQAAAVALGRVACRSDDHVVGILVSRLTGDASAPDTPKQSNSVPAFMPGSDPDAGVRRAIAGALGQLAPQGHRPTIAALVHRLEDRDGGVRRASMRSLGKVAEQPDSVVLQAVLGRTTDAEANVRETAVEMVGLFAKEGNAEVVSRLLVLVDNDKDDRVRLAATALLGRCPRRGDHNVQAKLLSLLQDRAEEVRRAAAHALGQVTCAPQREMQLQQEYISELECEGDYIMSLRDKEFDNLKKEHAREIVRLQQRVGELEYCLQVYTKEAEEREHIIQDLQTQAAAQNWLKRVEEVLPHTTSVARFVDNLPAINGPSFHDKDIEAPVWALRCLLDAGQFSGAGGEPAEEKWWYFPLLDLFDQLVAGSVTPMELTESKPIDVFVHKDDKDGWGLYSCDRVRLVALLMLQVCKRKTPFTVRCVIRPKTDGYWGWQWSRLYHAEEAPISPSMMMPCVATEEAQSCTHGMMRQHPRRHTSGRTASSSPESHSKSPSEPAPGRYFCGDGRGATSHGSLPRRANCVAPLRASTPRRP